MFKQRDITSLAKALSAVFLAFITAGCAVKSVGDTQAKKAPAQPCTISDIQAVKTDQGMSVRIEASGELNYTAVKQKEPPGVMLYFPLTSLGDASEIQPAENEIVEAVKPSMSEDKKNTRIAIRLLKDCRYKVEKRGSTINVLFTPGNSGKAREAAAGVEPEPAAGSEESDAEAYREAGLNKNSGGDMSADAGEVSGAGTGGEKAPALVGRVDFSARESGKSTVIIEAERPFDYDISKVENRILKVKLYNTNLAEYHIHRPLITTRFDSAVDRIIPSRSREHENRTNILIELREAVPYRPVQEGRVLKVHFDPSSVGPRPFEAASMPSWQKVLETSRETEKTEAVKAEEEAATEAERRYSELLDEDKEYTGQKIALDFYETNIKNVFRILQEVSGKNFAIDPNVSGTVTLSFRKPVPWDQVLDLVLQMNGLDKVEKDNIIRIATRETLRAEEEAKRQKIEAIKKRMEQQKKLEPMVTEYLPINYANAQNEVLPHVKDVLSKERGNITVDQRNNQLIITDTRGKIEKAKEIIAKIDKVTPQVIIEARIVEANDNFSRKIGVTWSAGSEGVYRSDLGGFYSYNSAINTPFIGGGTEGDEGVNPSTFNFSFERLPSMGTPFVLDATLRAMETDQVLKIISTPKIVTLDNKEATITQGQEWPYQNVEDEDVETEFKEINLTLKVTPHITPDDRVALEINLIKDDILEITESGEPALSTNEAQTELLIDDGQTIVIGGIVKRTVNEAESGVPVLKDLPGLGFLFRARQNSVQKRELLIFMTPNIVQLEQRSIAQVKTDSPEEAR